MKLVIQLDIMLLAHWLSWMSAVDWGCDEVSRRASGYGSDLRVSFKVAAEEWGTVSFTAGG